MTSPAGSVGSGTAQCPCADTHQPRRIVLTGGPGAGKTAVLEMVRRSLCEHVHVLPEAASIVFGGGFPRHEDPACRRAAQIAVYHVQRSLEVVGSAHSAAIILCDRGTVDGLAYWSGPAEAFWQALGSSLQAELDRYDVVIHLRTPPESEGYNHQNPLRTESPETAAQLDERILQAWAAHPHRHVIDAEGEFLDKAAATLKILRAELPSCCAGHITSAGSDPRSARARRAWSGPLLQ